MRHRPVVAIDGPAGAGKSTITQRVAEELGYLRVDTGALYRTLALATQLRDVAWDDPPAVTQVAQGLAQRGAIRFRQSAAGSSIVELDGEDVTDAIRTQQVAEGASRVSAIPGVRDALLDMQRTLGAQGGVVLEGRDIGTVVFPDAEAKFFLTASVEVRARRRFDELVQRGKNPEFEQVRQEVAERDHRDSTRASAPLRQAADAVVVDSSDLSIDEVVSRMVDHVRRIERKL